MVFSCFSHSFEGLSNKTHGNATVPLFDFRNVPSVLMAPLQRRQWLLNLGSEKMNTRAHTHAGSHTCTGRHFMHLHPLVDIAKLVDFKILTAKGRKSTQKPFNSALTPFWKLTALFISDSQLIFLLLQIINRQE